MARTRMGKITISLSKDAEKRLRERAMRNLRSISKEVEHILNKVEEMEK